MNRVLPKKLKKILKEPVRPPSSKRFCLNCNEWRRFKYNPFVCHSECTFCGCRFTKKMKGGKDGNN